MTLDHLRYELRLLGKPVFLAPPLVVIGFALLLTIVNHHVDAARSMGGSL